MVSVPAFTATPPIGVTETAPTERRDDPAVDGGGLAARGADTGESAKAQPAAEPTARNDVAADTNAVETAAARESLNSAVGVAIAPTGSTPSDPQDGVKNQLTATNQDSETESQLPGNDAKSQIEAHRTLGQVVDLFA